jgi:GNAT superfamily N-acetyltransferase
MADLILPYRPDLAPHFARLNREWIERFFRIEETDLKTLDDPEGSIIGPGGEIFFALVDGAVAGTAAAVPCPGNRFELAKMAVAPAHQGLGLGRRLGEAVIAFAREAGADSVFLLTNSRLVPAIHLYERLGFRHAPLPAATGYDRANVYMELALGQDTDEVG